MAQSTQSVPQKISSKKIRECSSSPKKRVSNLSKKSRNLSPRIATPKDQAIPEVRRAESSVTTAQETRMCARGLSRLEEVTTDTKRRSTSLTMRVPAQIPNGQSGV